MSTKRCSIWILGDQLLKSHPAIAAGETAYGRSGLKIVMIENAGRARRLPYHKKKIVLVFSAMRHYARWLEANGYAVDYLKVDSLLDGLHAHLESWQPERIYTMAASEYRGRRFQQNRLSEHAGIAVEVVPNTQFLVGRHDPYPEPEKGKRYVQEHFYRRMRRHFGLLIEPSNEPVGGAWNFDKENRKPLPEDAVPPPVPAFKPDAITREVMEAVEEWDGHPGSTDGFDLAVTHADARQAFDDFLLHRLPAFGPYEDAMSHKHPTLYHSVLSPYLNLGLLDPLDLAGAVEEAYEAGQAPINSAEGFIRQIVGWREYMYWQYWRTVPDLAGQNYWEATRPLPRMFWDGKTEMNCLRHTLEKVIETGYAHHIERLMLLSNFSLLAGLEPMAVNDWFLAHFIDAYEWVMLPNVLGMGLNADGGLTATKPYIASANYIHKMGDYCGDCSYAHTKRTGANACPFNSLYWNFLIDNEQTLRSNPRMGPNVLSLRHLDQEERRRVQSDAREFLASFDLD